MGVHIVVVHVRVFCGMHLLWVLVPLFRRLAEAARMNQRRKEHRGFSAVVFSFQNAEASFQSAHLVRAASICRFTPLRLPAVRSTGAVPFIHRGFRGLRALPLRGGAEGFSIGDFWRDGGAAAGPFAVADRHERPLRGPQFHAHRSPAPALGRWQLVRMVRRFWWRDHRLDRGGHGLLHGQLSADRAGGRAS